MDHLGGAALAALVRPHNYFPRNGGIEWWLNRAGLTIQGAAPQGTPGEPVSARRVLDWFGDLIRDASVSYGVPLELIVATILTESAGGKTDRDKVAAARRQEPGWVSDAATPHRVSVGCMQTLVTTARSVLDDLTLTADSLRDPAVSIKAGTAYMAQQAEQTAFDPPLVAAAYNAGSLREDRAAGNPWRLVCYPLGTGKHIGRFVSFFNDCWGLVAADPSLLGEAPSLYRAVCAQGPAPVA